MTAACTSIPGHVASMHDRTFQVQKATGMQPREEIPASRRSMYSTVSLGEVRGAMMMMMTMMMMMRRRRRRRRHFSIREVRFSKGVALQKPRTAGVSGKH